MTPPPKIKVIRKILSLDMPAKGGSGGGAAHGQAGRGGGGGGAQGGGANKGGMTSQAAARIQGAEARANGGHVSSDGFAARGQAAAAHNNARS
ncbi:hypothetical protein MJO28_000069 [Puccinia striiformis f. sp. tritici]|uniref:Uncharacterized protein n=4 Tax=Puccinia striiformis TaxID=27350 RepID=A0A2S4VQZ8_9BASI|nr:hypothetical protein Pst134EA_001135 [Puccinia striiformis f. sp. tritici]KAH9474088.1 hypothetical protein Pst134EA_001135 [Puccinia striiformis f. sp. tritici]KAI7961975.1 hypothetical protein MJO28_000069 [Puccinia striiformis f. sp. tritici]POW11961.1 hypothetical protein PSHT_08234 [Puccinia striiformis]POW12776.1 hypothetical protein PSTT_04360 [Puccinia striiformis]